MLQSAQHIASLLDGQVLNPQLFSATLRYVLFDSRQIVFPEQSLFFALRGKRSDGHKYIGEAYERGLRHFVVSIPLDYTLWPDANFFMVKDTLEALQKLAIVHRQQYDIPVIGITGSNGKTIIKEWLFQLLHEDYSIVRSPKSYNSQIGVPLSVLQMDASHELAIFEAGISEPEEMVKLTPIIDCRIGIFTNIGAAHDEGFQDRAQKIKEKLQLFSAADHLIYCRDDQDLREIIESTFPSERLWSWSEKEAADLQIQAINAEERGGITIIRGLFRGKEQTIQIPFTDQASIQNAIHCWACLLYLKYPVEQIRKGMQNLEPVAMRLELKAAINQCTLINDSYNADLNALTIALHFLAQQRNRSRRVVILSDILQSGQPEKVLYTAVARLLKSINIDELIGIGAQIPQIKTYLEGIKTHFYENTETFLREFPFEQLQDATILLKGARSFAFERIANRLELKNHNTVLEIDLNALRHNLNVYSQQLDKATRIMVMVKAAAYGSGGTEIAQLLELQRVDYLAVAYTDEGVALRKAGIRLPILVLNPEEATFSAMIRYQLEPEVYSLRQLEKLQRYLEKDHQLPIHLKLDTGMHRLGFDQGNIEALVQQLCTASGLVVRSVFSHLSASEDARHDKFTEQQFAEFQRLYKVIAEALAYRPLRHILNSSGITRFPQYQLDMVRLGIGLYGIAPAPLQEKLERVHRLKATISQIRDVKAGQSIGYARQGQAKKDLRIGTISIGYADGLLRKAGNGAYQVAIRNQLAPTIGHVCMDMTMVDISHIPEAQEGDEVIIFGENPSVEQLAAALETIPYEVFTNISERVRRVYFLE